MSTSQEHGERLAARERENCSWEEWNRRKAMASPDYIETYSGIRFVFEAPTLDMIDINDIAHALSQKCRYSGHCSAFYSVAEHSVEVSNRVSPDNALWGLLHDATEAYLPDVPRPIKRLMPAFSAWENNLMSLIASKYGLVMPEPAEVKLADTRILLDEAKWLIPSKGVGEGWPQDVEPFGNFYPFCYTPENAKAVFLDRFFDLMARRRRAAA